MQRERDSSALVSTKAMEMAVALLIMAVGAVVIVDSSRLGFSWGDDGPQSGYFPFYIGLILCISSAIIMVQALGKPGDMGGFVERGQAKLVLAVLVPSALYVFAVGLIGIYVASAIFIAAFMGWQGKFGWIKALSVGAAVSVVLFLMFEVWFKVPLPKGPLERLLGY